MARNTKIEWTETTWNPVTGCIKLSSGCMNCYAERMANRLRMMGAKRYRNGFKVTLHEDMIDAPLKWKKPQMIFVNSMSDLFLPNIPLGFIKRVFNVMNTAYWHTYQVLTKRADRLLELNQEVHLAPNIWMGVTIENQNYIHRIDCLRKMDANVKFLSLEPLLGPLPDLNLDGIDWVIVGGESGPGARPIESAWVTDIRDQCQDVSIPFFFKQWGGVNKKKTGRELEGRTWDGSPPFLPNRGFGRKNHEAQIMSV